MHELSLHLLDLLENAHRARATRILVSLVFDPSSRLLRVSVEDNGLGLAVSPERLLDPFFSTKPRRRAGLGLALLESTARSTGGGVWIGTSPHLGGARVIADFDLSHPDCPPIGSLAETLMTQIAVTESVSWDITLGRVPTPPEHWTSPDSVLGENTRFELALNAQRFIQSRINALA